MKNVFQFYLKDYPTMQIRRFCLTLDLKNDPDLILAYEKHHQQVWPEVLQSIQDSGIVNMEIYRWENRLFMMMEVNEAFSFERKREMDESNSKVQEWEILMWKYQQALPGCKPDEKWKIMDKIFETKQE